MCGSTFSFITDPIENLVSGVNDAIDSASRGVGDSIEQAAPAILAAVAMYYGIPASSVGAAEIAGAAEAGAITAADVAVATPYIDAGMVTGTALDAGAAGAAGAGGAIADQVPFNSLVNAGTTYVAPGGVGGAMAGVGTGADIVGSDWASGLPTTNGVAGIGSDAATTGLIQQLANFTGLSTDAVTRLGSAAISSLAGMYGAGKLSQASLSAANRLATANQGATALQTQMYNDQMARSQPFYQAGVNALGPYTRGIMGTPEEQAAGQPGSLVRPFDVNKDYAQSPWYQASLTKKLKDYTNKLGSMGLVDSGPMRQGVLGIAGQAGQEDIMNAYNRYNADLNTQRGALGNLAGFAAPANAAMTAAGTNYGTNVNNLATNTATNYANADLTGATARQSAYTGAGGAFANALTPNPLNAYLNKQLGLA